MKLRDISDNILRLRLRRDEQELRLGFLITGLIMILLFLNVAYLNYIVITSNNSSAASTVESEQTKLEVSDEFNLPTPTQAPVLNVNQTSTNKPTPIEEAPVGFRDYYINLGYGTNESTEWVDVTGTLGTYDISAYNNIQEVRLESLISVPTANGSVSVRLFNKTDGYAVWNSERTVPSAIDMPLLISEKINYDYGAKLYSVQMKSQLGVPATLIQARIYIVAE